MYIITSLHIKLYLPGDSSKGLPDFRVILPLQTYLSHRLKFDAPTPKPFKQKEPRIKLFTELCMQHFANK